VDAVRLEGDIDPFEMCVREERCWGPFGECTGWANHKEEPLRDVDWVGDAGAQMCEQTGPARDVCGNVLAYEGWIQGSTKKCLLHHGAE